MSVSKLRKAGRVALAKRTKKHKKHEDHVDESWLVPYADILTLLLALFIVLFASSTVDQQKLNQMSNVFNDNNQVDKEKSANAKRFFDDCT